MSNRYPNQDGGRNKEINRERQRYCHTSEYHSKHLIREVEEKLQRRLDEIKEEDPERYADFIEKRNKEKGVEGLASVPIVGSMPLEERGYSALGAAGVGALTLGAGLVVMGVGAAAVTNRTLLKDDESLEAEERTSRSVGRKMSYVGGVGGAVGTLSAVSASGVVAGLSGAGIASGVSAIGAAVGGGVLTGSIIVAALPVVAATGFGYGVYRVCKWVRSGKLHAKLIAA